MRRGSISVGPVSDLAALSAAPLGLLKWLKLNVQNEALVWMDGDGRVCYAFLNNQDNLVPTRQREKYAKRGVANKSYVPIWLISCCS